MPPRPYEPTPASEVRQLVIDIAGELAARRGHRFEDDTEAIRRLSGDPRFPATALVPGAFGLL